MIYSPDYGFETNVLFHSGNRRRWSIVYGVSFKFNSLGNLGLSAASTEVIGSFNTDTSRTKKLQDSDGTGLDFQNYILYSWWIQVESGNLIRALPLHSNIQGYVHTKARDGHEQKKIKYLFIEIFLCALSSTRFVLGAEWQNVAWYCTLFWKLIYLNILELLWNGNYNFQSVLEKSKCHEGFALDWYCQPVMLEKETLIYIREAEFHTGTPPDLIWEQTDIFTQK